MTEMA